MIIYLKIKFYFYFNLTQIKVEKLKNKLVYFKKNYLKNYHK
jgi:hypothetical protein